TAGIQAFSHRWLALETKRLEIHERPAPEILDQRDAVALRECGQLREPGAGGEPRDAEVARVHAQQGRDIVVPLERLLVVAQMGAVRGPDLEQPGPALR